MGFKEEAEYIEVKQVDGRTLYYEMIDGKLTGDTLEWVKDEIEF